MISTPVEYEMAKQELRELEERLAHVEREHPLPERGYTKAGIRKLIARIHEELGVYEGSSELHPKT